MGQTEYDHLYVTTEIDELFEKNMFEKKSMECVQITVIFTLTHHR